MTSSTPISAGPTPRAGARQWAALGVLVLAITLIAVDGTVLALAIPALTADLDPTATEILWIGDAYGFAIAGLLVTMGTLADRIGRKRLLLIGAAAFGLASIGAAFAPTAGALIAARVLLGIAGATLMPSTLGLIRAMFVDPRQRTRAIALWSAGAGGGAALGPLVGGALLEHFWWGSVFLINVPVMLVLIVAGAILLPESKNPRPGRFDLVSVALSLTAIVPFVYAIKHAASAGFDIQVAAALVISGLSGWAFVRRQLRLPDPLIEMPLFKIPAFSGAIVAQLISILAFSGLLYFFSLYLQLVRGYSPLEAGLRELPLTLASIVVVIVVAPLSKRLGMGRTIGVGLAASAVGLAGLAAAEGLPDYVWLGLALVVVGLGFGLAFTLTTDAVVSSVPPARAGAAAAVSETSYELGSALGIALLGTLLTLRYRAETMLPDGLDPAVADGFRESLARGLHTADALGTGADPLIAEAAEQARHGFVLAMQTTSIAAAVLLAVAAVVAWLVIPRRLVAATDSVPVARPAGPPADAPAESPRSEA